MDDHLLSFFDLNDIDLNYHYQNNFDQNDYDFVLLIFCYSLIRYPVLQVRRSERKPAGSGVVMLNQIVPAGNTCLAVGVFGEHAEILFRRDCSFCPGGADPQSRNVRCLRFRGAHGR